MNESSGALCQSKAVGALLQHQQVRPGQQLCGGSGFLLGRPKCNAVRQVLDGLGHVEGFFKPWVMSILTKGLQTSITDTSSYLYYRTPHYQSPETIARQHYTDTWVEQIQSYPIDGVDVKSLA